MKSKDLNTYKFHITKFYVLKLPYGQLPITHKNETLVHFMGVFYSSGYNFFDVSLDLALIVIYRW